MNNAIIKQKGVKAECQGMFTAALGQAVLGLSYPGNTGMLAVCCWLYVLSHNLIHGSKTGQPGQAKDGPPEEQYIHELLMMSAFVHTSHKF